MLGVGFVGEMSATAATYACCCSLMGVFGCMCALEAWGEGQVKVMVMVCMHMHSQTVAVAQRFVSLTE